jgi:hypothetical protein
MPDLQTILQENNKQSQRLITLAKNLNQEKSNRRLPNGWTIAVALVHLAFWDQRQVTLLRRYLKDGVKPTSLDAFAVNEPLAIVARFIAPADAVKLALEAAEAIDLELEKLTPLQFAELMGLGLERNLRRSLHRKDHLDKIEKALK